MERQKCEHDFDLLFLVWQSCDYTTFIPSSTNKSQTSQMSKNRKCSAEVISQIKLDAGGKPSTLFPPGGLVDLSVFQRDREFQKSEISKSKFSAEVISRIRFGAPKCEHDFDLPFFDMAKLRLPYIHSQIEKSKTLKISKMNLLQK